MKAFTEIFTGLLSYIKDHHRTGPTWNPSVSAPPDLPSSIPPPPVLPPDLPDPHQSSILNFEASDRAKRALMEDLNRGVDILKGENRTRPQHASHHFTLLLITSSLHVCFNHHLTGSSSIIDIIRGPCSTSRSSSTPTTTPTSFNRF